MTDYILYALKAVWTGKEIVLMVLEPRPPEEEQSSKAVWENNRGLMRETLKAAIDAGKLVPINKDQVDTELRKNRDGTYMPLNEFNLYEMAKFRREEVITWMEKEQILETLKRYGHKIPLELYDLIERAKLKDQSESPNSGEKTARAGKFLKDIFPAPEGTHGRMSTLPLRRRGH